ncbi:AAA family ATPase [Mycolicibacterium fluoranthenivorans]|uniref:Nuclease SbcCD subunit C n=1 Tax=Mycolicibacterium fluoranthenivorans TaxID=258505 RepID=A0A7X5ZCF9_9MYCO|nr:AAA family ATPase [Mycolicibacterium fluoranthenivorans]NIH95039.1 ABC-type lipoprotein export system ATPase subunit [Mycolicibacterium fluoranthenivorans]
MRGPEVDAEQSVQDAILQLLDADDELDAAAREVVLSALADVVDETDSAAETDWSPTYLTDIAVTGFRGIGRTAKLELHPAPGLTVISGRNGSGKSSFAEAVELALTGTSYRWLGKQALWSEAWRNLHKPHPCSLRVGFAREGSGPVKVGVDWEVGAELADRKLWTQREGRECTPGLDSLGWTHPLELYRPVLTYEELGRLFDGGPSALYDALAKLLGLEVLSAVEKRLSENLKDAKSVRDAADSTRKRAIAALSDSADQRAEKLVKLLKKHVRPLDEIVAIVTGADQTAEDAVGALRALSAMEVPTPNDLESSATRLRGAVEEHHRHELDMVALASERVDLLHRALNFHSRVGDVDCPVCGEGWLDAGWAEQAQTAVLDGEATAAEYRAAAAELKSARAAADALMAQLQPAGALRGVDLPTLPTYNEAAERARVAPDDHVACADHLESVVLDALGAAEALRSEAAAALASREDAWGPVAAQVAAWVADEHRAQQLDVQYKATNAAKNWAIKQGKDFRNLRLEPIAAQARQIWSELRLESNVDLGDISLTGTATKRKAILGGSVDGEPTQALSVMSQGEQNAVALALFLPRATSVKSPFRFVVLDDPIQAMDPSKIDGFVRVLTDIARTHQIIVFSHDDRLASVIRETGIDARLIEVMRESGSKVRVRPNVDPARRLISDAFAMIQDDRLADEVKGRVAPNLFRMALESAAKQAHYARQSAAGKSRTAAEEQWQAAKTTRQCLALAVLGDGKADVTGWLEARRGRKNVLDIGNAGAHGRVGKLSKLDVRDLEEAVRDLLGSR